MHHTPCTGNKSSSAPLTTGILADGSICHSLGLMTTKWNPLLSNKSRRAQPELLLLGQGPRGTARLAQSRERWFVQQFRGTVFDHEQFLPAHIPNGQWVTRAAHLTNEQVTFRLWLKT